MVSALLVFTLALCCLIMTLKHKSSDAGNLVMPKRNCQVLLLSEKVKSLELIRKIKTKVLRSLRSMIRIHVSVKS